MKKVQTACFLVLLAACGPSDTNSNADGRFGSPYEIVTNATPSAPDVPPVLFSDSLSVGVSYAGGCAEHSFELASNVVGDSASVWLRHDDGGDDCEARISERIELRVPAPVLSASGIYLLNPGADVPFLLRWDGTSN